MEGTIDREYWKRIYVRTVWVKTNVLEECSSINRLTAYYKGKKEE